MLCTAPVLHVNHFCRPVASLEFVTEIFAALIVAHRCEVTVVCLVHFVLFSFILLSLSFLALPCRNKRAEDGW